MEDRSLPPEQVRTVARRGRVAEHPSGTVTFLFTDIEGSTKLWEHHPEAMRLALARHDDLLRAAIEGGGGYVFKTVGDAFCAAFWTAQDGLAAALAAQRALLAEPWGETGPIRVRMALHTGATEERDGDYFGPPVNRVARLLSAGHGGQTLVSGPTAELLRDHLNDGIRLRDMGECRLKDLVRPERVFQVLAPDLADTFPALKTLDSRPNNLPVQPTALIGREREAAAAAALLRQADVRLLTFTGPGGTGKTRLSLQVAADLLDDFADGVFFVPLAPISDPALVASTIAGVLGVKEAPGQALDAGLKAFVHDKQLLLVLDNFEQVVPAAPLVAAMLAGSPGLKALVTSREVLRVYGERDFPVPPLALPDPHRLPPLEQLTQYEAVRLFITRAQAVKADFQVTNDNAPAVAEICARLDGLPLAIELAAARSRLLPPQALLTRLTSRLKLLTGGGRDLPARQQTLRGAVDWSYDLLEPGEQALFARLALFVGGCTFEAAEAVCNAAGDLEVDVLDGLAALVDKSLLRQSEDAEGEPCFLMLETIREYALERLDATGYAPSGRPAHAAYYLTLAEQAASELQGPEQARWMARLEREHDNLRAALAWALDQGDAEIGVRMGAALWSFWLTHGYLSEGRRRLDAALAQSAALPPALRALALRGAGILAAEQGDYARAQAVFEEILAMSRELGDRRLTATALNSLGMVAMNTADYARARDFYEQGLALRRELHDAYGEAVVLNNLGSVAQYLGDFAEATRFYEASLVLARQMGDQMGIAATLINLGEVALEQGRYGEADALHHESLKLYQEVGDLHGILLCLERLAAVAGAHGDGARAARLLGAAEALRESMGTQVHPSNLPGYERMVATARALVDGATWTAEWAAGRALPLDQAVAYAATAAPA
jgi:predicted ATPase/class 3 adenylate cyclase